MAAIPGRVSACSASKCVQPFVDNHTAQVYHSEACSCQAGSCPDQELDMLQPVTQGMLARGVSFISSSVKDHVQRSHWYRHLQAYQRNVHQLLQKWSKPSKVEEELNRGCECCKWLPCVCHSKVSLPHRHRWSENSLMQFFCRLRRSATLSEKRPLNSAEQPCAYGLGVQWCVCSVTHMCIRPY